MEIIITIVGHEFLKPIDHNSFIEDNVEQIISIPFEIGRKQEAFKNLNA